MAEDDNMADVWYSGQLARTFVLAPHCLFTSLTPPCWTSLPVCLTPATFRYNIGQVAVGIGDLGLAYQAFKIAVSVDSHHAESFNNLGVLELRKGNIDQARSNFQTAQTLAGFMFEPYFNGGAPRPPVHSPIPNPSQSHPRCSLLHAMTPHAHTSIQPCWPTSWATSRRALSWPKSRSRHSQVTATHRSSSSSCDITLRCCRS